MPCQLVHYHDYMNQSEVDVGGLAENYHFVYVTAQSLVMNNKYIGNI